MTKSCHTLAAALLSVLVLLAAQSGCNKESPQGGPAATDNATNSNNSNSSSNTSKDGFKLEVPSTRTVVEAGMRKEVTIKINRDGNFKEPVELSFKMPEGVTAHASKTSFEPNDNEVVLTLEAAADAKPGEASIDVTGKPQTGEPTTVSLPIEVRAASATTPAPTP